MISSAIWCKYTRKYFKDNKIAQAHTGPVKKASQRVKTDKILIVHPLFVICTCVTTLHWCYITLHSCYMKNIIFSQLEDCILFSIYQFKKVLKGNKN